MKLVTGGQNCMSAYNFSGFSQLFHREAHVHPCLGRIQEMVVLSGAHTIGGKGFGNPNGFDNTYFKILLEKPQPTSCKLLLLSCPLIHL